jgi:6-phosphofructokinase 1
VKVLFTGIQPTGDIHIGNYFGAIRNWVDLQREYFSYISIVDLHAVTIPYEPSEMPSRISELALTLYACGIDMEKTMLFVQSEVPGHADLTWLFNTITPLGELERMTQFKDKAEQFRKTVNVGLLDYPVLQAADILIYKAEAVPVGQDQIQHVEFTREVARHFNSRYGDTFPECQALLTSSPKILGLDGDSKMSKSKGNTIGILETPEAIWKKLAPAKTDPARIKRTDPGTPEKCTLFSYHGLVTPQAERDEVARQCRSAGIGCLDCKKTLHKNLMAVLDPIRERYTEKQRGERPPRGERGILPPRCGGDHTGGQGENGLEESMENIEPRLEELVVENLGEPKIPSSLGLSTVYGDDLANYVDDTMSVLMHLDRDEVVKRVREGKPLPAFEMAGPRSKIYFDPSKTRAAIVTCGGLCPGINNVIRTLVMQLHYRYCVKTIYGITYGFRGFIPRFGYEPIELTPTRVNDIHEKGGSILSSSRGEQDCGEIVDCLERMNVSLLFAIGGDGTLRGAGEIVKVVRERGLKISVIGIPKTVDIRSAHTEAIGAPNGIGIVKVMGRMSGFIAANAALAMSEVNFVLIPEVHFALEGPAGLYKLLEDRLRKRNHAVIIVAEGAGQEYVTDTSGKLDESGNPILGDIGIFLKSQIKKYFKEKTDIYVNIKYIDPSYMVRSVPANAHDSIFCMQLAQNAVHAGMAGKTDIIIGHWNGQFTHVPIPLATSQRKQLSPEDPLWLSVLEGTGQPARIG